MVKNPGDQVTSDQRCQHLSEICGLQVNARREKGERVYSFVSNGTVIKEAFTYPKAKLFAEGVEAGKQIQ